MPVHESFYDVNLEHQKQSPVSSYQVYRALTTLRNTSDALKNGFLITNVLNNTVLLILRKTSKEAVTLLINFSDEDVQEVDLTKTLTEFKTGVIKVASVNSEIQVK